eukprot:s704_g26.t1
MWTGGDGAFSHDGTFSHADSFDVVSFHAGGASSDPIQQFTDTAECALDPIEQFTATADTILDNTAEGDTADVLSEEYSPGASIKASAPCGEYGSDLAKRLTGFSFNAGVVEDGFMSFDGNSVKGATESFEASVIGSTAETIVVDHPDTQRALALSLDPPKPKFLWEQSPFLNAVFGSGNVVDDLFPCQSIKRPPAVLVDLTAEEPPIKKALMAGRKQPVYLRAIKQSSLMHEETKRLNYISGWTSIVLTNRFAFGAFVRARTECSEAGLRGKTHRTVMECLAGKATSTVGKRLGSMQRYVEYCAANCISAFPLDDANMYSYLSHLCGQPGAAGSSGKSFLEAVRFTSFMLGLRSEELRLISQRVAGLAELLMKRAPAIAQAAPLQADQVRKLERECCSSDSLQDRILLGGILIMLFGCARASDMTRVVRVSIDRDTRPEADRAPTDPCGYIELSVLGHKGAHSSTHKRLLLPVVAPMVSLTGLPWWDSWMEARMALDLVVEGELDAPIMNRFNASGEPTDQSLVAQKLVSFLDRLWVSRRNLETVSGDTAEDSDGSFEMPFSEPGESDGDSETAETDASSDAETDGGETVDDSTTLWELLRPELRPRLMSVSAALEQHKHTISGVVHLRKPEAQRFLCGRIFNVRYERRLRATSEECQKCTTCFSSREARPPT